MPSRYLPGAVLALLLLIALSAAAAPRTGVVLRDSVLRDEARAGAASMQTLTPGTVFTAGDRDGLWIQATPGDAGPTGWLRITDVRLSAAARAVETAPAAADTGSPFARLSRSITSLLGGGPRNVSTERNATIGIRGLSVADLETAAPDPAALQAAAAWRAGPDEARAFAAGGGLGPRPLPEAKQ